MSFRLDHKPSFWVAIIIIFFFFIDLVTPLGIAVWLFYTMPVLISDRLRSKYAPLVAAAVCTGLIVAGFFISARGVGPLWVPGSNRIMGISMLWIVAIVLMGRKKTDEKLQASEDKLKRVTENADVGLTRINRDMVYLSANPAYCKIAGKLHDQIVGHSMIDVLGAQGMEVIRPYVDQALRGETVIYEAEVPFLGSGTRSLHVSYKPEFANGGSVTSWVASVTDITELKHSQHEQQKLEEIKRASAIKDEFLATLSHELRTPLTSSLMWTQMIREKRIPPEKIDGAIAAIEKSMLEQNQLISDLLDVSRIVAGKIVLELGNHDLNLLIQQVVESIAPLAHAKSIRVELSLDPQIEAIHCDPVRIKQVLWNLLTNAIKFSPANLIITVKSFVENNHIKIQVADQGKGIKPEFLPYVFERFSQEDSSMVRKFGGLGLGLSIVKDLTRLHGGSVSVDSPGEGLGTTFTVTFPRPTAEPLPIKPSGGSEGSAAVRDITLSGVRILIVDDSLDNRLLIKDVLESMGAEVKEAESARAGMALLQDYRPDILLSDISMPEEDGLTFISKVRQLPKEKGGETPAIALTAHASYEDARKAVAAGFQMHLPKPIEIIRLGSAIADLLKGK